MMYPGIRAEHIDVMFLKEDSKSLCFRLLKRYYSRGTISLVLIVFLFCR